MDYSYLKKKALQIRLDIIETVYRAKTGHVGSSLSETDILTALYYGVMKTDPSNPKWPERDRFILSKGHAVEALYCILADKGFFDRGELAEFSSFGSRLIGHPNNKVPGIEANTGALGHGLSVAAGMALAAKLDGRKSRVFVLMGDGELAEGSVWEAAMSAAHYRLDNLVAVIDRNRLQISGQTEDIMAIDPVDKKWSSFGWHVEEIDGHDISLLCSTLSDAPYAGGSPTLIIARTVKGRGVSFMENIAKWHHGVLDEELYLTALAELRAGLEAEG